MELIVEKLCFNYKTVKVLEDISLNIEAGINLAILGPNGAGKTTFLKCLNKLLEYKNGKITIGESDLKNVKSLELARILSYVPQATNSIFPVTVFDMILLGRTPHIEWNCSDYDKKKVVEILKLLNIENLALKNFNELSGGQQQKVIIARALVQNTKLLLLDEPISSLDIRQQIELMELIRGLIEKLKITSVMIVHDLNIASRYSDKIVLMAQGKVFAFGTPEAVLTEKNIVAVYGISVKIENVCGRPYIIPLGVK